MPSKVAATGTRRKPASGPLLEGVRIIDFTRRFAGSFTTLLLGALGAEVLKVESQLRPDPYRGVKYVEGKLETILPRVGMYAAVNHSKLSCTLNLNKPEARELLRRLVMVGDVVADSFYTGVMEKYGAAFEQLRRVRPDIVAVTMSGFGQSGPYKQYRAYGPVGSSFGGVDAMTGFPDGYPVSAGGPLDGICSETLAYGTLAALFHRSFTGQGQRVETAMHEVQMSVAPESILEYAATGRVPQRKGNRDDVMAPHGIYPCAGNDDWLAIAVNTNGEWKALCGVLDRPELARDPRYATADARSRNQASLDPLVEAWTRAQVNTEAMVVLQKAGVPSAACQNVIQLLEQDPHLKARDMFVWLDTPGIGHVAVQRLPGDVKGALRCVYTPAPQLGAHNEYVFKGLLGLPDAEYDRLIEQQVIY